MILLTFRRQGLEEQMPYLFASAMFHRLVWLILQLRSVRYRL